MELEALRRLLAHPEEAELPVTDELSPFTVVDVTGARAEPGPDDGGAGRAGRVVVGLSRTFPAARPPAVTDVALCPGRGTDRPPPGWVAVDDPDAEAVRLSEACAANPVAASVLVQLLRATEALPVVAGVMAESFAYSMLLAGSEFGRWLQKRPSLRHRAAAQSVLVESSDGAPPGITITLNRPEVRNAYDAAMRDALVDILRGLLTIEPRPEVVLRGAGPVFCSGGDLSEFGTSADAVSAHRVRVARAPGPLLARLSVTARVHGQCVGAGVELPAFCSRVLATPDATFLLPEVSMGLVPGAGGTASVTARIGRHRTAFLALSARPVAAPTALAWGLVDEIEGSGGSAG